MGGDFDGGSFDSGSSSFDSSSSSYDSGSSYDAGSFAVQESLVEMLREQTSFAEFSSNMDSTVAREVENLTSIVEQGKEELDELARIALERNNLSFGAALADINSIGADFMAGLRADRAEAEARIAEADAAEAAALRDMNSNTFFKGLYTPAKKSGAGAVRGARSRTLPMALQPPTPTFLQSLSPPLRAAVFASAAGALLALSASVREASPVLSSALLLASAALGVRVLQEARGGAGN